MRKRGVYWLLCLALALLLLPLINADGVTVNLEPRVFHSPSANIKLTYSDPITITSANLLNGSWESIRTYAGANFTTTDNTNFFLTLSNLFPGTYSLVIKKEEIDGSQSPLQDDVVRFEYQPVDDAFNIHLTNLRELQRTRYPSDTTKPCQICTPPAGFATSSPFNATFNTTKPAWCKFSTGNLTDPKMMRDFSVTGSSSNPLLEHAITGRSEKEGAFTIWCDSLEYEGGLLTTFTLGYESVAPTFTYKLNPPEIVDAYNMMTNLSVQSDQKVYCTAETTDGTYKLAPGALDGNYSGAYQRESWTFIPFLSRPTTKTSVDFLINCTNRAGISATKEASIIIDLDTTPKVVMTSPDRYTAESSPLFSVQVRKLGLPVTSGNCKFTDATTETLTSDDLLTWNTTFSNLKDGNYTHSVECTIAEDIHVTGNLTFTIDTAPPPARTLTVPPYTCGDDLFTATVNLSEDTYEDSNFAGYLYNITYTSGNKVLDTGESSTGALESDFVGEVNKSYQWNVWPYDLAGNKGTKMTGTTKVLDGENILCDKTPPVGSLKINETVSGTLVEVQCEDGESGCTDTFSYDKLNESATAADCSYATPESYNRTITFYTNGSLCYRVQDKNTNNDTGFRFISINPNASIVPADQHCSNSILDASETGIDCGGNCATGCAAGETCTIGADCASGFCNENSTCEETSCSDGKKNGYETDVDCGGPSCNTCNTPNATCEANSDCASGYCDNGLCNDSPIKPDCVTNDDCSDGEVCDASGTCVEKGNQSCDTDADCAYGETCDAGSCVSNTEEEGISILGLVLLILGLLIMAGSGYWLYVLHQQRAPSPMEMQPAYQPRRQELSPAQRLALAKQRQAQIEAAKQRRESEKERFAKKIEERHGLVKEFAGEEIPTEKPEKQGEKQPVNDEKKASLDEGIDADFIDVRDLGKKKAEYTETKKVEGAKKEAKKREQSAFNDLDEVIGEEKQ